MADSNLNQPVIIQATRIDATSLPSGFSMALKQYLIQQGQDFGRVVERANDAGQAAYDGQMKNDEQDLELADHEKRIVASEVELADHEKRITANETELADHEQRIGKNEQDISAIKQDYVSKTATAAQSLASPLNVATSYSVNGLKVVGARVTGFPDLSGTGYYGTFNADLTQSISATYVQAESQALATQIQTARRRIKALEDALKAHGLISI